MLPELLGIRPLNPLLPGGGLRDAAGTSTREGRPAVRLFVPSGVAGGIQVAGAEPVSVKRSAVRQQVVRSEQLPVQIGVDLRYEDLARRARDRRRGGAVVRAECQGRRIVVEILVQAVAERAPVLAVGDERRGTDGYS